MTLHHKDTGNAHSQVLSYRRRDRQNEFTPKYANSSAKPLASSIFPVEPVPSARR